MKKMNAIEKLAQYRALLAFHEKYPSHHGRGKSNQITVWARKVEQLQYCPTANARPKVKPNDKCK
jgi:hypothetical protein